MKQISWNQKCTEALQSNGATSVEIAIATEYVLKMSSGACQL